MFHLLFAWFNWSGQNVIAIFAFWFYSTFLKAVYRVSRIVWCGRHQLMWCEMRWLKGHFNLHMNEHDVTKKCQLLISHMAWDWTRHVRIPLKLDDGVKCVDVSNELAIYRISIWCAHRLMITCLTISDYYYSLLLGCQLPRHFYLHHKCVQSEVAVNCKQYDYNAKRPRTIWLLIS